VTFSLTLSLKDFLYDWLKFIEIINFSTFRFSFNIDQEKDSLNEKQNLSKMMIFNKFSPIIESLRKRVA